MQTSVGKNICSVYTVNRRVGRFYIKNGEINTCEMKMLANYK